MTALEDMFHRLRELCASRKGYLGLGDVMMKGNAIFSLCNWSLPCCALHHARDLNFPNESGDDVAMIMKSGYHIIVYLGSIRERSFPCHLFFEKSGRVSRCTTDSYKPFIRATPA